VRAAIPPPARTGGRPGPGTKRVADSRRFGTGGNGESAMRISFCLITLNEEANLQRCLKSCADLADEIVILDSGSKDGTERIARRFGARWQHQDWLGYVGQKNKVTSLAKHEWVFSLD